jgi:hypothetical protein
VPLAQLADDFARYLYLPRLKEGSVLASAVADGVALLTWSTDGFAFADSYDAAAERYRGLRVGQQISLFDMQSSGLLVKPEVARAQLEAEAAVSSGSVPIGAPSARDESLDRSGESGPDTTVTSATSPRRFHGTVALDPARVGRDASRVADEVIAHFAGLVGANVTVTLEIEAELPSGAPDHVVRTVTENSRTLGFTSQGFERE